MIERAAAALAFAAALAGCVNLGPRAVEAGYADYNDALRRTADEQLLGNLVRLRYRESPLFLEVTAVTTQYVFSPRLTAQGAIGARNPPNDATLSGSVGYEEKPTVAYEPLQGEAFARRLLTPVSIDSLILLSHSGWSAERLFRLCVQRANGVSNAVTASGPTPSEAPQYRDFVALARALRELQLADALTVGRAPGDESHEATLYLRSAALDSAAYRRLVEILQLQPGSQRYPLRRTLGEASADAIGVQTRSLNGMLYFLAHAVEVPDAHFARGLVNVTRDATGAAFDWANVTAGLMRVQAARERPDAAAVRVRYRDHWYYIADDDLDSKSTFALLSQLFALQAGGGDGAAPVLTIPVGG